MFLGDKRSGFTLIELLVVIAIITLLSSIVFASLNSARVKARDAKRVADLIQIRNALELYYNDYGHYPNLSGATWACFDCTTYISTPIYSPNAASIYVALQPYLSGVPKDPNNAPGADSGYLYRSDTGVDYKMMDYRSPENMSDFKSNLYDVSRCSSVSGGNCSPGPNTFGFWSSGGVNY